MKVNDLTGEFGYFPLDFLASMGPFCCLYQLLQIMVMNCNGMYYIIGIRTGGAKGAMAPTEF